MHGLELRHAILEAIHRHQKENPETPMPQAELARRLSVDSDRLEAHFTFLERAGYLSFLHMPDPKGERQRFLTITEAGQDYLRAPRAKASGAGAESPFKVVSKAAEEKPITDFAALKALIEATEWVMDEEKPEIVAKLAELERVLRAERLDFGAVSGLKIYFERHPWLRSHIAATVTKHVGF